MKLTEEQNILIAKTVDKDFFNVDVIINYLENNEVITADIFKKAIKGILISTVSGAHQNYCQFKKYSQI